MAQLSLPFLFILSFFCLHSQAVYLDHYDLVPSVRPTPIASRPRTKKSISLEAVDDGGLASSQHSLIMLDFKRHAVVAPPHSESTSERLAKSASSRDIDSSSSTTTSKFYIDPNYPEHQALLQRMAAAERAGRPFILTSTSSSGRGSRKSSSEPESVVELPNEIDSNRVLKASASSSRYNLPLEYGSYQRFLDEIPRSVLRSASTFSDEKVVKALQLQLRSSLESLLNHLEHLKAVAELKMKKIAHESGAAASPTSVQHNQHYEPSESARVDVSSGASGRLFQGKDYDTDLRQYIVHYLPKFGSSTGASTTTLALAAAAKKKKK